MRVLILGDLGNIHIQKQCQWLVDHEIDILPSGSKDPAVIAYKIKLFKPMIVHAFGKEYIDAIYSTPIEIGLKVKTSPEGLKCVNTRRFKAGYSPFRKTFAKSETAKVVLVPNHMSPQYHYGTIINAFEKVLEKYPDATLVCHNPGEDVKYQEQMATLIEQKGMDEHVFSNGYVQYVRMPEIYNAADVVVALPAPETLSAVVMEAAACMKPVIATHRLQNSRLVFPVFSVDPGDPDMLTEAIINGFNIQSHVGELSNRSLVKELYEQDTLMDQLVQEYEEEMF